MKKMLLLFFFLLSFAQVLAVPTDGNYTLLQHNLSAGGSVSTDSNFTAFLSIGEPIVSQNNSDANLAMATGFFGTPIGIYVEEIVRTITIILMKMGLYLMQTLFFSRTLWLIVICSTIVLIFLIFLRRKKKD